MPNTKKSLFECVDTYVVWASLAIVFVVPSTNNFTDYNLKVYLVCVLGLYSWVRFIYKKKYLIIDRLYKYLIYTILGILLVNLLITHTPLSMFGDIYIQAGFVSLIAIIGIALNSVNQSLVKILNALFIACILLSVFSFFYQTVIYDSLTSTRLIGPFFQSDVLAVYLASGFIAGFNLINKYKSKNGLFLYILGELIILTGIMFTQTRLVVMLILILSGIYFLFKYKKSYKFNILLLTSFILIFIAFCSVGNRSYNPESLITSIKYRLDLQSAVIAHSSSSVFISKGAETLSLDLKCSNLNSFYPLRQTCKNYIFESSHNIFLDHSILFGYGVGIIMLFLAIYSIYRCLVAKDQQLLILGLIVTLISIYYFSNVNSIELELLFWIFVAYSGI